MASAIDKFKADLKETRTRVFKAVGLAAGSRVIAALALMLTISFAMAIVVSPPPRLPTVGVLTPVQLGLPVGIDLDKERALAQEIGAAAERQQALERTRAFLEDNAGLIPILNWAGLVLSLALLILALALQARRHRAGLKPL